MFLPTSHKFIWQVERDNSYVEDGQNYENAEINTAGIIL